MLIKQEKQAYWAVLNALKRELRGKYTLMTYTDPAEALEQIKKMEFKAVISDFNMPVVKGDEFIQLVRRIDLFTRISG